MRLHVPVFHHVPKPISSAEFRDAIVATCPPRFPTVHHARPQHIVLAISGGVDSMALAYLFSQYVKQYRDYKIADNPPQAVVCSIIEHGLRDGSAVEAAKVSRELRERLGLRTEITPLRWQKERDHGLDPRQLPNIEGLARRYRYQELGKACRSSMATSLFCAHHRDDQYETILMRLLAGHGYRGLQGIRGANPIPECYDLHSVSRSGLHDDQMLRQPHLSFKPSSKQVRRLRSILRSEAGTMSQWDYQESRLKDIMSHLPGHVPRSTDPKLPYVKPLDTEDGGIMVYRPLLEFDKDRLIATCEANNVNWFEDHTNTDPTLTTRNAVRHLVRTYELPRALQKPSILALARTSREKTVYEENEAQRLLVREALIKDFDPNVGTLLIQLSKRRKTKMVRCTRYSHARDEARKLHRRHIAALSIRKLVDLVSADVASPALANLETAVDRLFPHLANNDSNRVSPAIPSPAFTVASVYFEPVHQSGSTRWLLSRAPYATNQPLPTTRQPKAKRRRASHPTEVPQQHHKRWKCWSRPRLWDNRFWINIHTRVSSRFVIEPFNPDASKPFRRAIEPHQRRRLEQILKYYAPGKVRYSLPAMYLQEPEKKTLVALPSLGIAVPGLEKWVRYQIRYKKVDLALLDERNKGTTRVFRRSWNGQRRRRRGRSPRRMGIEKM